MIRAMAIWSSSRSNNIGFQSDADADTSWIGTDSTENTVLINIYRVNPRNPCLKLRRGTPRLYIYKMI